MVIKTLPCFAGTPFTKGRKNINFILFPPFVKGVIFVLTNIGGFNVLV